VLEEQLALTRPQDIRVGFALVMPLTITSSQVQGLVGCIDCALPAIEARVHWRGL
jgi:hypothetical protein